MAKRTKKRASTGRPVKEARPKRAASQALNQKPKKTPLKVKKRKRSRDKEIAKKTKGIFKWLDFALTLYQLVSFLSNKKDRKRAVFITILIFVTLVLMRKKVWVFLAGFFKWVWWLLSGLFFGYIGKGALPDTDVCFSINLFISF